MSWLLAAVIVMVAATIAVGEPLIVDSMSRAFTAFKNTPTSPPGYLITDAIARGFTTFNNTPTPEPGYLSTDAFARGFTTFNNTPTLPPGSLITDAFARGFTIFNNTPTLPPGSLITDAFARGFTIFNNTPTLPPGSLITDAFARDFTIYNLPPYPNDVAAVAIISPSPEGSTPLDSSFTPQVSFANTGINDQSYVPVRCRITGPRPSQAVAYMDSTVVPVLNAGTGATTVTFATVTLTHGGTYDIRGESALPGDQYPGNDHVTALFHGLPEVTVGNIAVLEGDHDLTPAEFPVTLSAPSADTVVVRFSTTDSTAVAGQDYLPISPPSRLTFLPGGSLTRMATVFLMTDSLEEYTGEAFYLLLSQPSGGIIVDGRGICTILNDDPVSGVADGSQIPVATWLGSSAPNPTGGRAVITFGLRKSGPVQLSLFDIQGRVVRHLVAADCKQGRGAIEWDGRDDRGRPMPSGVYLLRMRADGHTFRRSLRLLR